MALEFPGEKSRVRSVALGCPASQKYSMLSIFTKFPLVFILYYVAIAICGWLPDLKPEVLVTSKPPVKTVLCDFLGE